MSFTKSEAVKFRGGAPRLDLTAMYTNTIAQMMTTQKTAVFTFELMNLTFCGLSLT
jgi:hypothetical protein